MYAKSDELVMEWKRMVMAQVRRKNVLVLAHSNPLAGHLGVKKTPAHIR